MHRAIRHAVSGALADRTEGATMRTAVPDSGLRWRGRSGHACFSMPPGAELILPCGFARKSRLATAKVGPGPCVSGQAQTVAEAAGLAPLQRSNLAGQDDLTAPSLVGGPCPALQKLMIIRHRCRQERRSLRAGRPKPLCAALCRRPGYARHSRTNRHPPSHSG
ncbi:MAG: hypothetical protein RLZZ413_3356 [Pseudomonadota bacterium]